LFFSLVGLPRKLITPVSAALHPENSGFSGGDPNKMGARFMFNVMGTP